MKAASFKFICDACKDTATNSHGANPGGWNEIHISGYGPYGHGATVRLLCPTCRTILFHDHGPAWWSKFRSLFTRKEPSHGQ